jgi:hypothetical protein
MYKCHDHEYRTLRPYEDRPQHLSKLGIVQSAARSVERRLITWIGAKCAWVRCKEAMTNMVVCFYSTEYIVTKSLILHQVTNRCLGAMVARWFSVLPEVRQRL